jgi:hypothetical protein
LTCRAQDGGGIPNPNAAREFVGHHWREQPVNRRDEILDSQYEIEECGTRMRVYCGFDDDVRKYDGRQSQVATFEWVQGHRRLNLNHISSSLSIPNYFFGLNSELNSGYRQIGDLDFFLNQTPLEIAAPNSFRLTTTNPSISNNRQSPPQPQCQQSS